MSDEASGNADGTDGLLPLKPHLGAPIELSPVRPSREENEDEGDDGDISVLQEHMMKQSRTIDDFTRIIADWRTERDQRQRAGGDGASIRTSVFGENGAAGPSWTGVAYTGLGGGRTLQVRHSNVSLRRDMENNTHRHSMDLDAASQYSYEPSVVDDQDDISPSASPAASSASPLAMHGEGSTKNVKVRCTCCCGRGTRRCKRARRATREWGEVESDLRLAAEIGQALLRRNDALQSEVNQNQQDYSSRIDSLMKKLSSSIKEASQLEKQREQSELNLEASEASNRSLVRELAETRKEVVKLRNANSKSTSVQNKLDRSQREVGDLKQELVEERKKSKRMEKSLMEMGEQLRIARIEAGRRAPSEDERAKRREEMRSLAESRIARPSTNAEGPDSLAATEGLAAEVDELQEEVSRLREMLESKDEEIAHMRDEYKQREGMIDGVPDAELSENAAPPRHVSSGLTFGVLSSELIEEDGKQEGMSFARSTSRSPPRSGYSGSERQSAAFLTPDLASSSFAPKDASSSSEGRNAANVNVEGSTTGRSDNLHSFLSAPPPPAPAKATKENRTAQLLALIEMIQRLFNRLSSADVDTLSRRLQRQNLAGDVGHLARSTVNGILRDVDGLKDHFRKAMDAEAKGRDSDALSQKSGKSEKDSDSLVAKTEFYALIKVFRDLLVEIVKLRRAVNEVSLQPHNSARILQELLGINASEDKGVGAWIGRFFAAAPLPGASIATGGSGTSTPSCSTNNNNNNNNNTQATSSLGPGSLRVPAGRAVSGPQLTTSRASASVLPSTVAVEVKGAHASEQPSSTAEEGRNASIPSHARPLQPDRQRSLSRVQSRNLSGLFVGSIPVQEDGGFSHRFGAAHGRLSSEQGGSNSRRHNRLSRIVDDDEVSIHHQSAFTPKRGLRPRNLSDSSIRTTYMEDEDRSNSSSAGLMGGNKAAASTPISRIITPSTLSLQASSLADASVVHSYTSSSLVSNDSIVSRESTAGAGAAANPPPQPSSFLSAIAPRTTMSKALSFLSGPSTTTTTTSASSSPAAAANAPTLRSVSSSAKMSLAANAAAGSSSSSSTSPNLNSEAARFEPTPPVGARERTTHASASSAHSPSLDAFQVGTSKAKEMGF